MKLQGKIINWNDDKGFGFVEPNGGGDRAFVHIKAFTPRSRRPVNGEVIIYELVRDHNNRFKADKIKFALDNKNSRKKSKNTNTFGTVFTLIFCVALAGSVLTRKLPFFVAGLYILMSVVAFIAYAMDKSAAQSGRWRTQESTLHLFSLIGGWPGAFFAQNKLRHKSSKSEFLGVYRVTVVLNLGCLFWLHTENGTRFLNNVISPLLYG